MKNYLILAALGVYNLYAYLLGVVVIAVGAFLVICLPGLRLRRRVAAWVLKLCCICLGIRWRVQGLENFPSGACIVVGNHTSYLDGPILQMLMPPQVSFAIMAEVKGLPPAYWLLQRLGSTFITRGNVSGAAQQTRAMLRKLRAGDCIGIFAEGRIGKANGLQRFQRGAFMLATHQQQTPVVPVLLRGPEYMLPDHGWLLRPASLRVTILPACHPQASGREAALALGDAVHSRLLTALNQTIEQEQAAGRPR